MPLNHSNSDTRSFSNRRTKFTAAHIRKLISTGDLLHFNSITPTPIDQPKGQNVEAIQKSHKLHLSALAEPLDIEDILSNSTVSHPTTDNVSSSILFPPVDLELHPLPLTTLTVPSPIIPNDIDPYTIEPHIMDILERYSENSSKSFIISRKHQLYSSEYGCQKAVITQKKYLDKICKQSFEEMQSAVSDLIGNSGVTLFGDERDSYCSISSDSASIVSSTKEDTISGNGNTISSASQNSLAKDAIFPHLIGRTTPAALQIENSIKRNASKLPNLVSLLPISEEDKNEFNIEHRNIPNTSSCATSDLKPFLLFKVQELSFDPADLEPIFASITLFDLKEKRRLSESFYFDFNATHLNAMIQQSLFASGLLPKAALFQIQNFELLSDIFVVIKLEKVLQAGEANDIYEPYVKDHSSTGIKEKHQNFMIDNCKRLSNYRMPFAWTAIELSQVLQNGNNTSTLSHKKDNSYLGNNGDKYFDDSANIYSNDSSLIEETESILSMDHPTSLISPSQFGTLTKNKRTSNINSEPLTSPPVTPRKVSSLESSKPPNQRQQFQSVNNKPIIVKLHSFFRAELDKLSDEEIIKMLFENRKNSAKLSKMKSINSKFIIEITLLPPDWNQLDETNAYLINNCISSELKRWKNSIAMFNNYNSNPILREVLSFPAKGQYEVNDSTNLRNLLFIYPKMANFSNKSGNARNISIKIELMDSHEKPCKALYSRNSNQLVDKVYTSVSYHTKCPQFSDEIKINIPANLNDGYHILFTFCHISCKLNKHNDGVETEIAYTWLPLYQEKGCLQTGNNFHIPISLEPLPKGYCYLSPDVNLPNIKWLEAHKPLFQVSMSAITTIHTEDKYLDAFLRVYHSLDTTDTNDILNAVKNVTKSQPQPMVSFMYIIFDKLLSLITYSKISHKLSECRLAETCFTTLSQLIKICTVLLDVSTLDGHGRSSFLIKYIHLNKITTKSPFDNDTFNDSLRYGLSGDTTYDDLNKIIKKVEASNSMKNSTYSKSWGYTKFLHEELVQQWTYATGSLKDMSCTYSWFYLELIIKSMGELLLNQNSQMLYISRRTRFSDSYLSDLCRLQTLLTNEIIEKSSKDHNTARQINNAFAFFLQDSFSIMDRTFVMRLVKGYYNDIGIKISMYGDNLSRNLMLLRLEFTKILLSHEHIIALNLPMSHQYLCNYYDLTQPTNDSFDTSSLLCSLPQVENKYASISSSPNTFTLSRTKSSVFPDELSNAFKAQHFLIGVLLSDLVTSIHSNNGSIQNQAITNLKNLLVSHENDVRICNDKSLMERVAELYFPLLGICTDNASVFFNSSSNDTQENNTDQNPYLCYEYSKNLLSCFIWVLKFSNQDNLKEWIIQLPSHRLQNFVDVLHNSVGIFDFKKLTKEVFSMLCQNNLNDIGNVQSQGNCNESMPSSTLLRRKDSANQNSPSKNMANSSTSANSSKRSTLSKMTSLTLTGNSPNNANNTPSSEVKWRSMSTNNTSNQISKSIVSMKQNNRFSTDSLAMSLPLNSEMSMIMLCQYASSEVYLTILDTIESVLTLISLNESELTHLQFLLPSLLRSLSHLLTLSFTSGTLENIFASQRLAILMFPDFYFSQHSELCQQLCLQLLRHLASKSSSTRSHASATKYILMRHSFESHHSFSRLKMQITMALSTLVSNCAAFGLWNINECDLKKSLSNLLAYLENDCSTSLESPTALSLISYTQQVKDLIFNLHMILSDTTKLKHHCDDFEFLLDLMYRIAKGYQNNPDLRLTWLLSMAGKNIENNNFTSAAMCLLHVSALLTEYLSMIDSDPYFKTGAALYSHLTDNILEESAVSDDVISPEEEGICESWYFSREGLKTILEQAATLMEKVQMFELASQVYQILVPILQKNKDFSKVALMHEKIAANLRKIEGIQTTKENVSDAWMSPISNTDKRHFGSFYRVGFYGEKFGEDLNGEEFIYREVGLTQLSEISHRLEAFYVKKFGSGVVEIIKDSSDVDRNKLNTLSKAYIQITYVEPYFDSWEKKERTASMFERRFNVKNFVYATPFTKDGKAHGELKDQFKRKTILTTQNSFPYIKSRIRVVKRQQSVLTPIEAAVEDIQKKTRELHTATVSIPTDPKILQMVLQGCIGTTVNSGPIFLAKVFLGAQNTFLTSPVKDKNSLERNKNKLRLCYKDFSKKCHDALVKNEQLISVDQVDYQKELKRNYIEFTNQLTLIFKEFPHNRVFKETTDVML